VAATVGWAAAAAAAATARLRFGRPAPAYRVGPAAGPDAVTAPPAVPEVVPVPADRRHRAWSVLLLCAALAATAALVIALLRAHS